MHVTPIRCWWTLETPRVQALNLVHSVHSAAVWQTGTLATLTYSKGKH